MSSQIDILLDELEHSLAEIESEVEQSLSQLSIDYERAVRRERDRITEVQDKIRVLHSQKFAELREACLLSRARRVEILRDKFGDCDFVRFYEQAPFDDFHETPSNRFRVE